MCVFHWYFNIMTLDQDMNLGNLSVLQALSIFVRICFAISVAVPMTGQPTPCERFPSEIRV